MNRKASEIIFPVTRIVTEELNKEWKKNTAINKGRPVRRAAIHGGQTLVRILATPGAVILDAVISPAWVTWAFATGLENRRERKEQEKAARRRLQI